MPHPTPTPAHPPPSTVPDGGNNPPALMPGSMVPRWAVHRRMYDWVLSWAHRRHGTAALALLSFAESSFFPIPPDVLQIALTLERREKAFFYAGVSVLGSVLGGLAGYLLGWAAWQAVDQFFLAYVFSEQTFHKVEGLYREHDFWCVFVAAFTPIPYKVFTIAAGVFQIALVPFIIASAVGRAGRFFLVAALLWKFGAPMKTFIEKYFNLLTVAFTLLLVGAFALLKLV